MNRRVWFACGFGLIAAASAGASSGPPTLVGLPEQAGGSARVIDLATLSMIAAAVAGGITLWFAARYLLRTGRSQRAILASISREFGLSAADCRALSALARAGGVSSPIVLMLCPSALDRAIAQHGHGLDARAIGRLTSRLRG